MNDAIIIRKYKYLGTSDERLDCECCGKNDLKRTVAIECQETGKVWYFGTSCAAKALRTTTKEVNAALAALTKTAKAAEKERVQAEARAARAAQWTAQCARAQAERATREADHARQKAERQAAEEARWARINGTSPWVL